jgi:hypothetical protein
VPRRILLQVHNFQEMSRLISLWDGNRAAGLQRAGYLYGRILADSNFRYGQKVVIEGIYEPPQTSDPVTGVIRFLPDAKAKLVHAGTRCARHATRAEARI